MKNKLDIVFILDKSGSMHGSEDDTIGGYNRYIEDNIDKDAKVTTVLFNDTYELLTYRKNIQDITKMNNKIYRTEGCTALYDAIGKTINKFDKEEINNKVMFIITTDGLENASSDYNKEEIIKLIKSHKNYQFIYLGSGIDSYAEGTKLGIDKRGIANYAKSKINNVFASLSKMTDKIMCDEELDESWKENLE